MTTQTKPRPAFLADPRRACATVRDPDIFFPVQGSSGELAKAVCRVCDFCRECREYAIERDEAGIWGATTPQERAWERKKRRNN